MLAAPCDRVMCRIRPSVWQLWVAEIVALGLLFGPALAEQPLPDEERILNIYNWADYIGTETVANFEAEYGIKVNYDNYDSSEIVDSKLLAGRSGYDLILHGVTFASRLLPLDLFQQLNKDWLPNLKNLDPDIVVMFENYDPGLNYMVPYFWGSVGFAYNKKMVAERLPGVDINDGALFFDPAIVSKLADCGVSWLDSPTDVIPMALLYLGYDSNSIDPLELEEAEQVMQNVRPYVRYYSSTKILLDLPNQEVCVAMAWSGESTTAMWRARQAGLDVQLGYEVPRTGFQGWFDAWYIPADAKHVRNAHLFLDFINRPEVNANIVNETYYSSANRAAWPYIDPEILNDPILYPGPDILSILHFRQVLPPKQERVRSRLWARVKTGM